MGASTIDISSEIKGQIDQLAAATHREVPDLINEALASYIAADRRYTEILKDRIAAADRGDFATDDETEAFFSRYAKPQ